MKFVFYVMVLALFITSSFSDVKYECNKQCIVDLDPKTQEPTGDLNCTLSAMPKLHIDAPNVLNSDGTLKKYFETNNTVCDVLGLDE